MLFLLFFSQGRRQNSLRPRYIGGGVRQQRQDGALDTSLPRHRYAVVRSQLCGDGEASPTASLILKPVWALRIPDRRRCLTSSPPLLSCGVRTDQVGQIKGDEGGHLTIILNLSKFCWGREGGGWDSWDTNWTRDGLQRGGTWHGSSRIVFGFDDGAVGLWRRLPGVLHLQHLEDCLY